MPFGKEALCVGAGVLVCVALGGCFGQTGSPVAAPVDSRGITPRARSSPEVPDLRIPRPVSASADEIPVVPLPIPGAQRPGPPAAPAPKPGDPPATTQGPALPPADVPP